MPLSSSKQIAKIDDDIKQLKAKKQAIINKEKQQAKKERTRLLIQYGELVEKYLKCESLEELEVFLKTHRVNER